MHGKFATYRVTKFLKFLGHVADFVVETSSRRIH